MPRQRSSPSGKFPNEPEYIATGHPDTAFVPLADGTLFPESLDLNVLVRDGHSTKVAGVSLEVREGHPIITQVAIFGFDDQTLLRIPLTPTMLHGLNFGKIFEAAV